ncbi:MAG: OmpH family outer membrane protein, partial [Bdellovibrio sp.]|nr:OmpH family outer membrane protein [Bdellovibrio sp.]
MKNTFIIRMLVIGFLGSSVAIGAETRVATVDMQKAIQNVETGKKAKSDLEKALTLKRKEIQDEEAKINKMGEEFKKQSLVMNEEARAKKQSEIQERIVKLQQLQMKSQTELQQKEQTLTAPILNKLRQIIQDIASKKGYS